MSMTFEYNATWRTAELGINGINAKTTMFRTPYGLLQNPENEIVFNGLLSDLLSDYSVNILPLGPSNVALFFAIWTDKEIGIKFGFSENSALSGVRYLATFADISAVFITTGSAARVFAIAYGGSNTTVTVNNPLR